MTTIRIPRLQGAAAVCLVLAAVLLFASAPALADWTPNDGHKMHWPQLPDEQGWDVNATNPVILADDWKCSESGPVTNIHFWGSWRDMDGDGKGDVGQIASFTLSIHEDIPAVPGQIPYSRPGETLREFTVESWSAVPIDPPTMEAWLDPSIDPDFVVPNDHDAYFQYNVDLIELGLQPFEQVEGTIYWLNISATLVDSRNFEWGWKSSTDHWNDDAVWATWGDLSWDDIVEPPRFNEFNFWLDPSGNVVGGGGTNYYSDGTDHEGWYFYEETNWWNIWFYDNPFTYEHSKLAMIVGQVVPLEQQAPSEVIIAVNWSTDVWSEGVTGRPPLPGDPNENQNIGREIIFQVDPQGNPLPPTGVPIEIEWEFPDYNPEWISIDVRGFNFAVIGSITHECVTTSLDLAFVINGPSEEQTGACCWPDGSCSIETKADCEGGAAAPGTYLGDGTVCLGDANNDGIDDACGATFVRGACCLQDGSCIVVQQSFCLSVNGTYLGDNTSCLGDADGNGVDDACESPPNRGACCWPDGTCTVVTQASCVWYYGTYLGDNTACQGDLDGNGVDDACDVDSTDLKWEQPPDLDPTGMDVKATYYADRPSLVLADDFRCTITGPLMRIHVYGSWMHDLLPAGGPKDVDFVLSIHEDIPAVPGQIPYSRPGELLCLLTDLPFKVKMLATDLEEDFYDPMGALVSPGDRICWEYIFYLGPDLCIQEGSTAAPKVYWLDVQAFPSFSAGGNLPVFGWKTSKVHWNDDATWAEGKDVAGATLDWKELIFPPNHPFGGESIDLAFKIIGSDGTPPTGACCWPDGTCSILTRAQCEHGLAAVGGTYQGDGTSCLGDNNNNGVDDACEDEHPTGACCYTVPGTGVLCANTTQSKCLRELGGTWYPGQNCNDPNFQCPDDPPNGACCYVDAAGNENCINSTKDRCIGLYGGTWYLGKDCATWDCPTPEPMGACCYGDPASPSCVNTTLELCKKVYNGNWYMGMDCANFDCPTTEPLGACCFDDPTTTGLACANTTKTVCLRVYGGTWYEGQDCANFDCPTISPMGACCYGDPTSPTCVNTTESDCIANYGGNWYLGRDCANFVCPVPEELGACCFGNPASPMCVDGITQWKCRAEYGGQWYPGRTCTTINCPTVVPLGACCFDIPGATQGCANTSQVECLRVFGGNWYPGQDCNDPNFQCPEDPPQGACCYVDAAGNMLCANTSKDECIRAYSGTWYLGKDCATWDCPTPDPEGACCYGDPASPSCVNTTKYECKRVYGGKWYPGQDCSGPNFECPTGQPTGACCFEDPTTTGIGCVNSIKEVCLEVYGGTWYEGQDCATFSCPDESPLGACCYGDADNPSCINTTQTDCIRNYGGTWYLGKDCSTFECPVPEELGACCYGDADNPLCVDGTTKLRCESEYGGKWYPGQTCTSINCPPTTAVPIGACCYESAVAVGMACVNTTQAECLTAFGGTWYAGQDCADFDCLDEPAQGACCYESAVAVGMACVNTTQAECLAAFGGTWYAGEDCSDFECPEPEELGACCFGDPASLICVDGLPQWVCKGIFGGAWYAGRTCGEIDCAPILGACCYGDPVSCANTTEDECNAAYGGTWYAGQNCATFQCPTGEPTGACCWPDGTCSIETKTNCEGAAITGTYLGDGSLCIGDLDGNGVDDACEDPPPPWKWLQPPNLEPTGMDVRVTEPVILADDFLCTVPGDIAEVSIWTSWLHDEFPGSGSPADVSFVLSLHTDVPSTSTSVPVPVCPIGGDGFDITVGLPSETAIRGYGRMTQFGQMEVQSGGRLKGFIVTFEALFELQLTNDGVPGFSDQSLTGPVEVEIHTGPRNPGAQEQTWAAEIVSMSLTVSGGDFCDLILVAGTAHGLQSTGQTTITDLGDGNFNVDSFFDITYEIEFEGCPGTTLEGLNGTTEGTVRMASPESGGDDCTTPDIGEFSYPGDLICLKNFAPGEFEVEEVPVTEEDWFDPMEDFYESPGDHNCYKYTFKFEPGVCVQEGTVTNPIVYWLDVQAFVPEQNVYIGWKTSRVHWNDDAAWNVGDDPVSTPWNELRYPEDHPFYPQSIDLAFQVVGSGGSCCVGMTGNFDNDPSDFVDLGDLTGMIDYLFISFIPPVCMEEANCDGSTDGIVDLGDLTAMIDYLFISFTRLAPCQ